MGLFFQESPGMDHVLEDEFDDALSLPAISDDDARRGEARRRANSAQRTTAATRPKLGTFIAAAVVFGVLLGLAFVTAQAADSDVDATVPQMQQFSELMQTLVAAWSAAVLGLIGGEAVGKKS